MVIQLSAYALISTRLFRLSLVRPSAFFYQQTLINGRNLGLLQHLEDCGSPPLASRAPTLTRPTSLKTSDNKSMMAYLGLPLDLFGTVRPYDPFFVFVLAYLLDDRMHSSNHICLFNKLT